MPPAARATDMHVCPMVTGIVPHVGGPILPPCEPTVLIGFLPAARVSDMLTCAGPPDTIALGSMGVLIGNLPAARMGDMTAHGGSIVLGCPTVMIGEMGSPAPGGAGAAGISAGMAASTTTPPPPVAQSAPPPAAPPPPPPAPPPAASSPAASTPPPKGKQQITFKDGSASDSDPAPAPSPEDKKKADDKKKLADQLKVAFPNLGENFTPLGPPTQTYNCIAHTLGLDSRWVNPVTDPGPDKLAGMDALYAAQGYKRLSTLDYSSVPGVQKVVVYATVKADGSVDKVTHGAIQTPTGAWTSKLGGGPLIQHPTPDAVNGALYGQPVAVYAK